MKKRSMKKERVIIIYMEGVLNNKIRLLFYPLLLLSYFFSYDNTDGFFFLLWKIQHIDIKQSHIKRSGNFVT